MNKLAAKQCTLAETLSFSGIGVHNGLPVTVTVEPAPPDSGYLLQRIDGDGRRAGPVTASWDRITSTSLCTVVDLGDSMSVATTEHLLSALAGLAVDNALITIDGPECPIIDGSARPYVDAIINSGIIVQAANRRFYRVTRSITVRDNDAYAVLEPHNGRSFDVEIDFNSDVIGHQRMIFDWSPRRFSADVAPARTFGFVAEAKVLRQAGYALGSSLENSIAVEADRILNPEGLRFEDEFVRHKLLDALGDMALAGLPIYGRFRSYKGGHKLNAMVLTSLFDNPQNYEIVGAGELPLEFDALNDFPDMIERRAYLRSVG